MRKENEFYDNGYSIVSALFLIDRGRYKMCKKTKINMPEDKLLVNEFLLFNYLRDNRFDRYRARLPKTSVCV